MSDNLTKAQCKHFFGFLLLGSNLTLKNHINHPHCEALKMVLKSGKSSMSRDGSVFMYNPDAVRKQFTREMKKPCLSPNWDVTTRWNSTYHMFQCGIKHKEFLIESILIDLECFDDDFATKAEERFTGYFQGLYNHYYLKYGNPTTQSTSAASSSTQSGGNPMVNLFNRLKDHSNKRAKNDRLTSFEYEIYLSSDFISHLRADEFAGFDVLGFWKAKKSMFPILSRMAQDMLSVQATSVASESAVSTSGRELSIRRTRLTPASLEMCKCIKDHLDTQDRIQNTSSLEHSLDFEEYILEEEVQDNEAIPLLDEEIALDEAASEAMSGSGGEDVDLTLSESD
ncbi:zinc finger BED domain-containing protein RICESLEEPER 2 [Tanacetum coccineum]